MSENDEGAIALDVESGVAVITLRRGTRHNALTPSIASHFVDLLEEVDRRDEIGSLVLCAEGPSFCSGADLGTLADVKRDPLAEPHFTDIERIYAAFTRFGEVAVPTIAAIQGPAVGAGLNLAMAADTRIVSPGARFISGFLKIGLHPGGGHFSLLSMAAGQEPAAAIGLFGAEIDGEEAVERGLAWLNVPADELHEVAVRMAQVPAANPALSRRAVKTFRTQVRERVSLSAGLQLERASQLWSFHARENRE